MDTAFWIAVSLGVGTILGMYLNTRSTVRYLQMKAEPKYRTAAYIGDRFYYIVPEQEYVSRLVGDGGGEGEKEDA